MLNYKKPAFWIIMVAVVATIAVAVCFLTNPKTEKWQSNNYGIVSMVIAAECEDIEYNFIYGTINNHFPHIEVDWKNNTDDALCFGNEFVLYKDNQIYTPIKDIVWEENLNIVNSDEIGREIYNLSNWDLSGSGSYRLEKEFYLQSNPQSKYHAYIEFKVDRQYSFLGRQYKGKQIIYESFAYSSILITNNTIPEFIISEDFHLLTTEVPNTAMSTALYNIGELQKIDLVKSNLDDLLAVDVWYNGYSAKALRKNNLNAFYVADTESNRLYYLLEQKNGDIFIAQGYAATNNIRWIFKMKE